MIGAPIMAAFCASSIEMRLDNKTMPSAAERSARNNAPANLSRALWRSTSSRTSKPASGCQNARHFLMREALDVFNKEVAAFLSLS